MSQRTVKRKNPPLRKTIPPRKREDKKLVLLADCIENPTEDCMHIAYPVLMEEDAIAAQLQ